MSEPQNDPTAADPELDELLDSALQDMVKKPEPASETKAPANGTTEAPGIPNMFSEDFIREAAAQFESNMAAILGSFSGIPEDQITQEQIADTFTKMAEAAAHVMTPNGQTNGDSTGTPEIPESNSEVTAAIAQTLQNLNASSNDLQAPFTDQDLANMFSNFNLDGQDSTGNMFVPFMQGMMQSLLSKEVLYPSLKELLDKYPAWIKENDGKVDAAEMERYKKQETLMSRVCSELEGEREDDAEEVRRKRFETVLTLMQEMQDLGQPPSELVGDMGVPPQGFAAPAGLPGQDNPQCAIM